MKQYKLLTIIFLTAVGALIASTKRDFSSIKKDSITDSIYPVINTKLKKRNLMLLPISLKGWHKKFGLYISDYYDEIDSLKIKVNTSNVLHSIIVLSPVSLDRERFHNFLKIDTLPTRLLLHIVYSNGKPQIAGIYDNLISNAGGVLSKYSGIFETNQGFKIAHEAGNKFSWRYVTTFEVKKNKLIVTKIQKRCSYDDYDEKIVYRRYMPAERFNLLDTLNKQCNCDNIWNKLVKTSSKHNRR
jgi:hypothetical protein